MTCPQCNSQPFEGCIDGFMSDTVACPQYVRVLRVRQNNRHWPIPPRYEGAALAFFPPEHGDKFSAGIMDAHEAIRDKFLPGLDKGPQAILQGDCGVGKSHLAAAAVKCARSLYKFAIFASATEIETRAYEAVNGEDGELDALVRDLEECDLLVIDDIGKNRATEFVCETLYKIVDRRYENLKATILTTNDGVPEIQAIWGARAMPMLDRMREDGFVLSVKGKSLRGRMTA